MPSCASSLANSRADSAAISAPAKTPLTKNQINGFLAAWGGWALDGMDSFIYSLVLVPALTELLPRSGIEASAANKAMSIASIRMVTSRTEQTGQVPGFFGVNRMANPVWL